MAAFMNLGDIKTATERAVKQFTGSKSTMLEHLINMVYLTEVMSNSGVKPFFWLLRNLTMRRSIAPIDITGITVANPAVISVASGHGHVAGNRVELASVAGMTEINGMLATVASVAATTITTDIDSSGFTAWSSGGQALHRGVKLSHSVGNVLSANWNKYTPGMRRLTLEKKQNDTKFHNYGNKARPTHFNFEQVFGDAGEESNYIDWYPAADAAYLLNYNYIESVVRLEADADVPLLPARFHDAIVSGVVARLSQGEGDTRVKIENATLWPQVYSAHLAAIKEHNDDYWNTIEQDQVKKPYLL